MEHLVERATEAKGSQESSRNWGTATTQMRDDVEQAHIYMRGKGLAIPSMSHVEMMYAESGWTCGVQKRENNVLPAGILF